MFRKFRKSFKIKLITSVLKISNELIIIGSINDGIYELLRKVQH